MSKVGDYVLVHVGFALSTIDEAEAVSEVVQGELEVFSVQFSVFSFQPPRAFITPRTEHFTLET